MHPNGRVILGKSLTSLSLRDSPGHLTHTKVRMKKGQKRYESGLFQVAGVKLIEPKPHLCHLLPWTGDSSLYLFCSCIKWGQ